MAQKRPRKPLGVLHVLRARRAAIVDKQQALTAQLKDIDLVISALDSGKMADTIAVLEQHKLLRVGGNYGPRQRGTCPRCWRSISLCRDGQLYSHGECRGVRWPVESGRDNMFSRGTEVQSKRIDPVSQVPVGETKWVPEIK